MIRVLWCQRRDHERLLKLLDDINDSCRLRINCYRRYSLWLSYIISFMHLDAKHTSSRHRPDQSVNQSVKNWSVLGPCQAGLARKTEVSKIKWKVDVQSVNLRYFGRDFQTECLTMQNTLFQTWSSWCLSLIKRVDGKYMSLTTFWKRKQKAPLPRRAQRVRRA